MQQIRSSVCWPSGSRQQAVKNLARFIRSEINVAARLEGNAKEKNEEQTMKRNKKKRKQTKMLSKKCATKKRLYVERGMSENERPLARQ